MSILTAIAAIWSLFAGAVVLLFNSITNRRTKTVQLDLSLYRDHYWALEEGKIDQTVRDFTINVEDELLDDLKNRLRKTRIFDSLQGTNFEYGMRSDVLKDIVDHWAQNYDWKRVENELNQLRHFKTTIEGLSIHFIHVKARQPTQRTVPILLVHGWPGSFFEFVKSIPHLENDFDLVIPSLPGYGFSEAPEKVGCSAGHVARILNKLMKRLGYSRFVYQGGDWGALIGNFMASLYPEDVIGLHLNLPTATMGLSTVVKLLLAQYMPKMMSNSSNAPEEQQVTLSSLLGFVWRELGYAHIQATKPDTVAYALNDSPAGLAAYIIEKFSTWTDPSFVERADGGLYEKFSLDDLLTNVTIYWVNGNITSSVRLYKETLVGWVKQKFYITVPTGLSPGRHEIINLPQCYQARSYANIIHYNNKMHAGHFLFFECPEEAADDLKVFINKLME